MKKSKPNPVFEDKFAEKVKALSSEMLELVMNRDATLSVLTASTAGLLSVVTGDMTENEEAFDKAENAIMAAMQVAFDSTRKRKFGGPQVEAGSEPKDT